MAGRCEFVFVQKPVFVLIRKLQVQVGDKDNNFISILMNKKISNVKIYKRWFRNGWNMDCFQFNRVKNFQIVIPFVKFVIIKIKNNVRARLMRRNKVFSLLTLSVAI